MPAGRRDWEKPPVISESLRVRSSLPSHSNRKSIGTQAKRLWCWVRHLRTPLAGWGDGIRMVGPRRPVRPWLCGTGSVLGEKAPSRGGFYVRWLCGRWGTRSFGPRTAGRCRGRTWRSCSSAGPDRRDTWSAGTCRAAIGTGASSETVINQGWPRSHLLLYVLELLLELLDVSVHVSVVFVSLQSRDVSTGCVGTTTKGVCRGKRGKKKVIQLPA